MESVQVLEGSRSAWHKTRAHSALTARSILRVNKFYFIILNNNYIKFIWIVWSKSNAKLALVHIYTHFKILTIALQNFLHIAKYIYRKISLYIYSNYVFNNFYIYKNIFSQTVGANSTDVSVTLYHNFSKYRSVFSAVRALFIFRYVFFFNIKYGLWVYTVYQRTWSRRRKYFPDSNMKFRPRDHCTKAALRCSIQHDQNPKCWWFFILKSNSIGRRGGSIHL